MIALLAFGLVFAAIGYAAASANTVAISKVGDGQGALASYTLNPTSIQVTLDKDNDPALILRVRFTITSGGGVPAPQTVKAGFLSSGGALLGNWYSACTNISGTTWECLPGGANARVENGIRLRVIAVQ
jgi:hypothetical protein